MERIFGSRKQAPFHLRVEHQRGEKTGMRMTGDKTEQKTRLLKRKVLENLHENTQVDKWL